MEILLKAICYILGYIVGGIIFLAFLCHDEYKEMKYDKQFFRDKENKDNEWYGYFTKSNLLYLNIRRYYIFSMGLPWPKIKNRRSDFMQLFITVFAASFLSVFTFFLLFAVIGDKINKGDK